MRVRTYGFFRCLARPPEPRLATTQTESTASKPVVPRVSPKCRPFAAGVHVERRASIARAMCQRRSPARSAPESPRTTPALPRPGARDRRRCQGRRERRVLLHTSDRGHRQRRRDPRRKATRPAGGAGRVVGPECSGSGGGTPRRTVTRRRAALGIPRPGSRPLSRALRRRRRGLTPHGRRSSRLGVASDPNVRRSLKRCQPFGQFRCRNIRVFAFPKTRHQVRHRRRCDGATRLVARWSRAAALRPTPRAPRISSTDARRRRGDRAVEPRGPR